MQICPLFLSIAELACLLVISAAHQVLTLAVLRGAASASGVLTWCASHLLPGLDCPAIAAAAH